MYWSMPSRVLKAGASASGEGRLYVWLLDEANLPPKHNEYFELEPSIGNQLLATALTALSLDLPVDVMVGEEGDPKNPDGYHYCTVMYVRRG